MNEIMRSNDKRVTLREIAEITGAAYSTVAGYAQKAGWTKNGVETLLDEKQTAIIVEAMKQPHVGVQPSELIQKVETTQSRTVRLAVLAEKRLELEKQFNAELEAEIAELRTRNESLETEAAENRPKLEHYEACMSAKDAITMRHAAALNIPNLGRNKLFAVLRDKQILDRNNIPYRKYQDMGLFRVIENSYADSAGDKHTVLTTLVFPDGLDYIRRAVA